MKVGDYANDLGPVRHSYGEINALEIGNWRLEI